MSKGSKDVRVVAALPSVSFAGFAAVDTSIAPGFLSVLMIIFLFFFLLLLQYSHSICTPPSTLLQHTHRISD